MTLREATEAARAIPDEYISFLFIDGCHGYGYVKKELETWLPKVKSGGYISGHDYCVNDIERATTEVLGKVNYSSGRNAYWWRKP